MQNARSNSKDPPLDREEKGGEKESARKIEETLLICTGSRCDVQWFKGDSSCVYPTVIYREFGAFDPEILKKMRGREVLLVSFALIALGATASKCNS